MNDYENLEKLLEKSGMDDYMMYTKEDLIDFGQLVVKECIKLLQQEWYTLNNEDVDLSNITPRDIGYKVGQKSEIVVLMEKIKKHFGVE